MKSVKPSGTLSILFGKVDHISVAVLIDNHTKLTTGSDGKPQPTQEPRNADDMKKYKDLISAAIGFNPDRGDQLTVENISFEGDSEFIEKPTFLEKQAPVIMIGLRYLIIPGRLHSSLSVFPAACSEESVWQTGSGRSACRAAKSSEASGDGSNTDDGETARSPA